MSHAKKEPEKTPQGYEFDGTFHNPMSKNVIKGLGFLQVWCYFEGAYYLGKKKPQHVRLLNYLQVNWATTKNLVFSIILLV